RGLITQRSSLALTDELAVEVYGLVQPPFATIGYHRRSGETGWWIHQAAYERQEQATGLRARVIGALGAATEFTFDVTRTYPIGIRDPRGNVVTAEFSPRIGRVRQVTDTSGATCRAAYDPLARVIAHTYPGDSEALPTETFT